MSTITPFFSFIIDALPLLEQEQARTKATAIIEQTTTESELLNELLVFGKTYWPTVRAFQTMYEQLGGPKALSYMDAQLPQEMNSRWQDLRQGAQSPHDVLSKEAYEETFTDIEDHQIQEVWLQARDAAKAYVSACITEEKATEYQQLLTFFQSELQTIEEQLKELTTLAAKTDKWQEEIAKIIEDAQKGFAFMEVSANSEAMQETIDWYKGQIEAGNQ